MHTFDSCRSFGSPSSFSILGVSMHVKEQFSSRIKNNAQNRAKKLWRLKFERQRRHNWMTHNALLFSSSVSFRPHNSLHLSLQSLLTITNARFARLPILYIPLFSAGMIEHMHRRHFLSFVRFGLVCITEISVCLCVFFWQAALRNGIRRNWTSTFTMQKLQTEEEKNVVRCKSTSYTN